LQSVHPWFPPFLQENLSLPVTEMLHDANIGRKTDRRQEMLRAAMDSVGARMVFQYSKCMQRVSLCFSLMSLALSRLPLPSDRSDQRIGSSRYKPKVQPKPLKPSISRCRASMSRVFLSMRPSIKDIILPKESICALSKSRVHIPWRHSSPGIFSSRLSALL